jgi:hypothetical protein
VKANPTEMLSVGALYFNFSDTDAGFMDGQGVITKSGVQGV